MKLFRFFNLLFDPNFDAFSQQNWHRDVIPSKILLHLGILQALISHTCCCDHHQFSWPLFDSLKQLCFLASTVFHLPERCGICLQLCCLKKCASENICSQVLLPQRIKVLWGPSNFDYQWLLCLSLFVLFITVFTNYFACQEPFYEQ